MYCTYQDREELEDDIYQDDSEDPEGSEANSELEFHLYSQLHYSSNVGEMEEQEDAGEEVKGQDSQQLEVAEKTADADREQENTGESRPVSPSLSQLLQHLKKKKKKEEKRDKQEKGKSNPKVRISSSSLYEEVIVIDSSPDVISISEDDTADDDDEGVCALKGKGFQRLQTSTPAQQVESKEEMLHVTTCVEETDCSPRPIPLSHCCYTCQALHSLTAHLDFILIMGPDLLLQSCRHFGSNP